MEIIYLLKTLKFNVLFSVVISGLPYDCDSKEVVLRLRHSNTVSKYALINKVKCFLCCFQSNVKKGDQIQFY